MEKIPWTSIAGILFLCLSIADGYSKYGRSCSDIGCRSNEECVMAEDPCPLYRSSSTECGKYPKCSVKNGGGASCRTTQCPLGKYCKTVDGQPTCVDTSSQLEYESAGVSSVNGHRINGNNDHNINPYANANAPPSEHNGYNNYPPQQPPPSSSSSSSNSGGNNLGYPPLPSNNNNNNNNNNGYPQRPPSHSETDLGYPPYPTYNRQPVQPVYPPSPNNYPTYPNRPGRPYNSGFINLPSNLSIMAPAARRPGGRRKIIVTTPPPVPPRSSSFGFDGRRYPGNSRNTIGGGGIGGNSDGNNGNRGSSSIWNGWGGRGGSGGKSGGTKQTDNHSNDRGNYYKTHISSDSRGNKVWTFSG